MNFPRCHIEFTRAWPVLNPQPGLSFGVCSKKKISSVTRITRAVTVSRGGAATSARSKHRANPPYCKQGSCWRSGVCVCMCVCRTDSPVRGRGRAQLHSHQLEAPQTTDRIRGFSCKGPSSSLHLNLVWQQPPQTQTPLYAHLITPPMLPIMHAHTLCKPAHVLL